MFVLLYWRCGDVCLTYLEDFKSCDVKYSDKGSSGSFSAIQRPINALHQPFEHSLVHCFADRLYSVLDLSRTGDKKRQQK